MIMVKYFKIENNLLVECSSNDFSIRVFNNPSASEIAVLKTDYNIDDHTLTSSIDSEEEPRFEHQEDYFLIVWKCPKSFVFNGTLSFEVSSVAIFVFKTGIEIILPEENNLFSEKTFSRVQSNMDLILRILSKTIVHFQSHLKTINMVSKELKQKVNTSMDNRYLLQMFELGESLVYYYNAISSNGAVLDKIHHNAAKIGMSLPEIDHLNDVQVDNNQCCKKAEILSSIIAGLMDARGTVVNNNVNSLLRKLTIINTIFLPLNLIASMFGMSEYTNFTSRWDWRLSYLVFSLAMVIIGLLVYYIIEPGKLGISKLKIIHKASDRK